jgi:hypothetical protein
LGLRAGGARASFVWVHQSAVGTWRRIRILMTDRLFRGKAGTEAEPRRP